MTNQHINWLIDWLTDKLITNSFALIHSKQGNKTISLTHILSTVRFTAPFYIGLLKIISVSRVHPCKVFPISIKATSRAIGVTKSREG